MKFPPSTVQTRFTSPLGEVTVAGHDQGLVGVFFDHQRHLPDIDAWPFADQHPLLLLAVAQLREYFDGQRRQFALPLDLSSGTPFQQSVWRAMLAIPCGASSTYGAISQSVGRPKAMRAVGAAVGLNPLSVIVPCHRVLGADRSLTGYAGGLPRKIALLRLEGLTVNDDGQHAARSRVEMPAQQGLFA